MWQLLPKLKSAKVRGQQTASGQKREAKKKKKHEGEWTRNVGSKVGGMMASVRIIDAKRKCAHFREVH